MIDQLPSEVLQLVFDHLPAGDARFTVGRVCRAWASAAAQHRQQQHQQPQDPLAVPELPLWYVQQLWDQHWLPGSQVLWGDAWMETGRFIQALARTGQVAALQHVHDTGGWSARYRMQLSHLNDPQGWMMPPTMADRPTPGRGWAGTWQHCSGHSGMATCIMHGDERLCQCAARGGHLAVLQWLRENGCPWGVRTCSCAAGGGHLAAPQWAPANGCPWSGSTCSREGRHGNVAVGS